VIFLNISSHFFTIYYNSNPKFETTNYIVTSLHCSLQYSKCWEWSFTLNSL